MNISPRPFLTADLPGTGGELKAEPEDFVVEEIPAYEPSGQGTHVFLWIEKRDASAKWLLAKIAEAFGVSKGDIGVAGNKDRQAMTRQWVSIPEQALGGRDPEELVGDLDENISILRAIRHENKLRTGHLRGNKFRLRMGDLEVDGEEALKRAQAIVERIESGGMPNYYGLQRFGRRGETLAMGWGLLRREKAVMGRVRRDRFLKRLALSAAQSDVFNRVLCRRIEEGLWGVVLEGDVLQKVDSGGIFVVGEDEVEESQRRLDEHEVVITGPMPGPKMRLPEGASGEYEAGILEEAGATGELFSGWGKILTGTRRALAVYPEFHGLKVVDEDKEALELEFSLPSGSYATVLMREISKKAFCT